MNAVQKVTSHLKPGHVYRRGDLSQWSNAVDRHLKYLQDNKILTKLAGGLYYCPRKTTFGATPPADKELIQAFLKDTRFLVMNYSVYNSLGVGTTQLYNDMVVYNHKRHGKVVLGSRTYLFVIKPYFPSILTPEFLMVDLVDTLPKLPEDQDLVLNLISKKAHGMDQNTLKEAIKSYGGSKAKKFFAALFQDAGLRYGA